MSCYFGVILSTVCKVVRHFIPQLRFDAQSVRLIFNTPPPPPESLGAGYKTGNKIFLVISGLLNTSRPVACFRHELPTGVQMLPDYSMQILGNVYI